MSEKKIHICTEPRVGVMTRTWCGLEVVQSFRGGWYTPLNRQVLVTREKSEYTCKACDRCVA